MTLGWQRSLGIDLEVPSDFGYWFSGFVDGEACFQITANSEQHNGSVSCRFGIRLRDDDAPILHEIQEVLGVGRFYKVPRKEGQNGQMEWLVCCNGDLFHVIVPLLEKFPLRAKKRRDFLLWSKAVRLIQARAHLTAPGREEVLRLKREMEKGRRYKESSI